MNGQRLSKISNWFHSSIHLSSFVSWYFGFYFVTTFCSFTFYALCFSFFFFVCFTIYFYFFGFSSTLSHEIFYKIIYSLRRFQMAYSRNCMNKELLPPPLWLRLLPKPKNNNNVNVVNVMRLFGARKIRPVPMLVLKLNKNSM